MDGSIGYVKVYQQNLGGWDQVGLRIFGEAAGDQGGDSISLNEDGTRVAIYSRADVQ